MRFKLRMGTFIGLGAGTAVMLVLAALFFRGQGRLVREIDLRARKTDLVERLRYTLAASSEAEKSAVLAVTDQDSRTFAEQAQSDTAEVERLRGALSEILAGGASEQERRSLAAFTRAFGEYQRIDRDLLAMAIKNTNIKAFALAFGPAAQAAQEVDAALSHFLARHATSPQRTLLIAARAQAAVLRLDSRLAPHIAEPSDQKMDEMETLMTEDDREARGALDALAAQTDLRGDADLANARASYTRFSQLRTQILALSRENTNLHSLTLSLNQKRKAMSLCQDALQALQQEIAGEPTPAAPTNPRRMEGAPPSTG